MKAFLILLFFPISIACAVDLPNPHFENPAIVGFDVVSVSKDAETLTVNWLDDDGEFVSKASLRVSFSDLPEVIVASSYDVNACNVIVLSDDGQNKVYGASELLAEVIESLNTRESDSLIDKRPINSRLYDVFNDLPVEVRFAFSDMWVVVDRCIQPDVLDYELAYYAILNAEVTEDLQSYKDQLLLLFNN